MKDGKKRKQIYTFIDPEFAAFPYFQLVKDAHNYFITPHKNCFKREFLYLKLFESLVEHVEEWTEFLSRPNSAIWAERTVGTIGTYATILRQRGTYAQCKVAVDCWYTKALDIYTRVVEADYAQYGSTIMTETSKMCHRGLTFKYLVIKMNLYFNMEEWFPPDIVSHLRFMMTYELDTGMVDSGDSYYAVMLKLIGKPVTLQALASCTKNELKHMWRKHTKKNDIA